MADKEATIETLIDQTEKQTVRAPPTLSPQTDNPANPDGETRSTPTLSPKMDDPDTLAGEHRDEPIEVIIEDHTEVITDELQEEQGATGGVIEVDLGTRPKDIQSLYVPEKEANHGSEVGSVCTEHITGREARTRTKATDAAVQYAKKELAKHKKIRREAEEQLLDRKAMMEEAFVSPDNIQAVLVHKVAYNALLVKCREAHKAVQDILMEPFRAADKATWDKELESYKLFRKEYRAWLITASAEEERPKESSQPVRSHSNKTSSIGSLRKQAALQEAKLAAEEAAIAARLAIDQEEQDQLAKLAEERERREEEEQEEQMRIQEKEQERQRKEQERQRKEQEKEQERQRKEQERQ